jgi:Ca2+-binding EF-hand superfamily protein
MDADHNGYITFNELYEALRNGQPNCEFNKETVRAILEKYDDNHDDRISFNEFKELFLYINDQFNDFLDIDVNFSGSIDGEELAAYFQSKNFKFSQSFFNNLIKNITRLTKSSKVSFDFYLKTKARFDALNAEYIDLLKTYSNNNLDKESFFAINFFKKF